MGGNKLSELMNQNEHRFFLVNVLAKRCRALIGGDKPLIKIANLQVKDPTYIALEELKKGKLSVQEQEKEEPKRTKSKKKS